MLGHSTPDYLNAAMAAAPISARDVAEQRSGRTARPWYKSPLLIRGPGAVLALIGVVAIIEVVSDHQLSGFLGRIMGSAALSERAATLPVRNAEANIDANAQARIKCLEANISYLSKGYEALYQRGTIGVQNVADIYRQGATEALQLMRESQATNNGIAQGGDALVALGMLLQNPDWTRMGDKIGKTFRDRSQSQLVDLMRRTITSAQQSMKSWNQGAPAPQQIAAISAAAMSPDCKAPPVPEVLTVAAFPPPKPGAKH